jgi:hypothetical protein
MKSKTQDTRGRLINKIQSLVPVKISFSLPKSILAVYRDLQHIEGKVVLIWGKIKKTESNINVLNNIQSNANTDDMIRKQNEYYNYLCKYYDNYCSLYLELRFHFYVVLIKDVLIEKNIIDAIEIKQFINSVYSDMKFTKYALIDADDIDSCLAALDRAAADKDYKEYFFSLLPNFPSKKEKEKNNKNKLLFNNFNKSMTAITKKISMLAAYLVSVQSHKIIGDTSPIDEENELKIYKQENSHGMILEHSRKLDGEYDRFVAEIELSENQSNN